MPIPFWKCKFCGLIYTRQDVAKNCEETHRNLLREKYGDMTSAKIERLWDIGVSKDTVNIRLDKIGREIA